MKETFTGRIREAARAMAPDTFTKKDLSIRADIRTIKDHQRVAGVIQDMLKSGEIVSVSRGVYSYAGKAKKKLQLREVMWRAFRAMRTVTVEDLREMSGATDDYVREWLRMLSRQGVVQEKNGRFRMIKDPGPGQIPENDEKAEKLRTMRQRRKEEALAALDQAETAINAARKAVNSFTTEDAEKG